MRAHFSIALIFFPLAWSTDNVVPANHLLQKLGDSDPSKGLDGHLRGGGRLQQKLGDSDPGKGLDVHLQQKLGDSDPGKGLDVHLRGLTSCSQEKWVQIYKFCINGNDDAGASGEHQLRFDGTRYYPNGNHDCDQNPDGYCVFREGQCHTLKNPPRRKLHSFKSITVGTEEYDTTSQNDSVLAYLTANDWYNPTCSPYEVIISRDFSSAKDKSLCWNVDVSGTNGKGEINAGIDSCTTWTDPAESFIWFMMVSAVE